MTSSMLEAYAEVAGEDVIDHLYQLAMPLKGMKVVHVNSTRVGGGVAEILNKLVPLMKELGLDASWEVISGEGEFYECTKNMHNGLQGAQIMIPDRQFENYEKTNAENAERLRDSLREADMVFIHDPQPAPLRKLVPDRKGKWIWRCHIDISRPYRPVWRYLRDFVAGYDASIFSLAAFAQALPSPEYLVPPSIDPLSEKNIDLPEAETAAVYERFGLDPERPIILQVSRYDRFKDPLGVIRAYRMATKHIPSLQLVLAGGGATDDPEGEAVYQEALAAAAEDPDVHVLLLAPDEHRTINALQRVADIVLQKSTREGFGLTVAEAMWKGKPVIGGDTGGIRLQVINHHTGFLVNTPEGAAMRIRYLLRRRQTLESIGAKAKDFVRDNFLLTRHLREYLTLIVGLTHMAQDRIELG
ncbi:MAG: glycosyltransferase [Candidatus Nitrospinota bacterium M3_3B_026]